MSIQRSAACKKWKGGSWIIFHLNNFFIFSGGGVFALVAFPVVTKASTPRVSVVSADASLLTL
jgi:hypothetical protein